MTDEHFTFSLLNRLIYFTLVPLILVTLTPPFLVLLTYTIFELDCSFTSLLQQVCSRGLFAILYEQWTPLVFGTATAWKIIGIFASLQLMLMLLPGKPYEAPMHASGHIPRYTDNGLTAYIITCALFFTCSFGLQLFPAAILYDNFKELFYTLNIFALIFCLFLYIKGLTLPSSSEYGSSGNFIFDYYWGTELYPRIFWWDVKLFTNSRFGLMFWQMMVFSAMAKQFQVEGFIADSMWVCGILQMQYLFKFYMWEEGYFKSTDIVVDRAGFYLCWGCLVFLFVIFNVPHIFLISHPVHLGIPLSVSMVLAGIASIWITFWVDQQKVIVRRTEGKCLVFGKKPEIIIAKYRTAQGDEKRSILLCSGFWGVSRQFHYIPEWLAALIWSLPAKFSHICPYIYIIILFLILLQRSFRDEWKCSQKYGKYWDKYCAKVRYRLIPYLI